MNKPLSKLEILIVAIGAPLLIYSTQDWSHADKVVVTILIAAAIAVIGFAIKFIPWWLGPR